MKKSILLVSDTKNWGGWKRAMMIRKYLKDYFDFVLMDAEQYNNYERNSTQGVFSQKDVNNFISSGKHGNDKDHLKINQFDQWLSKRKIDKKFDLIYFLFHTMLVKKSVKRTLDRKNSKVITMVTVYPTIRPLFMKNGNLDYRNGVVNFQSTANKCNAILANNIMSLNDLKSCYKGQTFYAPRGVDPEIFYPTSNEFVKKPESQFTVAFCGKANPEKGLESVIKPACREAGVRLITNERNFENALPEHEMRDFYNKADVYIVASTMDGTPNTALEAASCGKPIISNMIGNMPEFIVKGHNGWLLPDLKVRRYINKLTWMKKNQEKVWEMGKEARKTIFEDWTWKKVINNNEKNIFMKVLNGM